MKPIRFTRSARRHRIGKAHALHVMNITEPIEDEDGIGWIGPDDIDLDAEEMYLDDGTRLTEARAAEIAETAMPRVRARRAGRPSLTGASQKTPNLTLRVTQSTRQALEEIAARQGRRLADVGREALDEYIDHHRKAS